MKNNGTDQSGEKTFDHFKGLRTVYFMLEDTILTIGRSRAFQNVPDYFNKIAGETVTLFRILRDLSKVTIIIDSNPIS